MTEQLPLDLGRELPLEQTPFIAHAGAAEAQALVDRWPQWPDRVVALVGPEGSGKSHLAALWARRADATRPAASSVLTIQAGPVLLEDADRAPADEHLFHLINRAHQPGGALLMTAREPPSAWPTTVPDLRSRLNAVRVVELAPPDETGFEGLLCEAFRRRGVAANDELITWLARRTERSALAARRVAERLDAYALATGRPVTRAAARELLDRQPGLFEEP